MPVFRQVPDILDELDGDIFFGSLSVFSWTFVGSFL